jgi:hypothetical protein
MRQKHVDYQVVPYPKLRRIIAVMLRSLQRTPMIHGLLEVDVTRAREFLREHLVINVLLFHALSPSFRWDRTWSHVLDPSARSTSPLVVLIILWCRPFQHRV